MTVESIQIVLLYNPQALIIDEHVCHMRDFEIQLAYINQQEISLIQDFIRQIPQAHVGTQSRHNCKTFINKLNHFVRKIIFIFLSDA